MQVTLKSVESVPFRAGARTWGSIDAAVVFHLDPCQRGFIELSKSQISDSFEHRQQASFDSVPKALLLAVGVDRELHPIQRIQNIIFD